MPVRKIAISLPEDVLAQVDRLAQRTKTTRSGCIARVLSEVSRLKTQAEITERINLLFASSADTERLAERPGKSEIAEEQAETAAFYLKAAEAVPEDPEW